MTLRDFIDTLIKANYTDMIDLFINELGTTSIIFGINDIPKALDPLMCNKISVVYSRSDEIVVILETR